MKLTCEEMILKETMEASQYRDGGSASDYNKVTFNSSSSSLYESKLKGNKDIVIGSGFEVEAEPGAEGIDLSLKL